MLLNQRCSIFFASIIPHAAAAKPPILFVAAYPTAFTISPLEIIFTTSTENVEKVVKDPQKPTPRRSVILGVSPCTECLGGTVAEIDDGLTSGEPKTPPSKNDPKTFIPAVCQPLKYFRLGSFAILSAANLPTW
mmetsp:Transcript_23139/g.34264  ORF Transcript_23139/g.34264 Transcript_23139/m.34264 type:complete len:134 (-) Transcript_23139:2119-2520(-)